MVAVRLGDGQPRLGERPSFLWGQLLQPIQDLHHSLGVGAVHPDIVVGEVVRRLGLQVRGHVLGGVALLFVERGARLGVLGLFSIVCVFAPVASPEHRFLRCGASSRAREWSHSRARSVDAVLAEAGITPRRWPR